MGQYPCLVTETDCTFSNFLRPCGLKLEIVAQSHDSAVFYGEVGFTKGCACGHSAAISHGFGVF